MALTEDQRMARPPCLLNCEKTGLEMLPRPGTGLGVQPRRRPEMASAFSELHATALGGPDAVVSLGRHIVDAADLEASGLERTDRGLAA